MEEGRKMEGWMDHGWWFGVEVYVVHGIICYRDILGIWANQRFLKGWTRLLFGYRGWDFLILSDNNCTSEEARTPPEQQWIGLRFGPGP